MKKRLLIVLLIIGLLFLVGCKKECKDDIDCEKAFHTAQCLDNKCVYTPIPGECGNLRCEPEFGESPANCEIDCGECSGKTGDYLEWMNIQGECLEGIKTQKPIIMTDEVSAGGDRFRITTSYNEPFNLKKDLFTLQLSLISQGKLNSNEKITGLTLIGTTKDRRTITLAEKMIDRPIFQGQDILENLKIAFPSAEKEGEFKSIELKVNFAYSVRSGSRVIPKTAIFSNKYRTVSEFPWADPKTTYPCPASCDDGNPGTQDSCIGGFCEHTPIPNACGNHVCDAGFENKCTCPGDCGPCSGPAGAYTTYTCQANNCVAQIVPGLAVNPQSLFDDRNLNVFHLQNTYSYNQPFNTQDDKIDLNFQLYDRDEGVSGIKITSIRLLESTNVIATSDKPLNLGSVGSGGTIQLTIPKQSVPESEKSVLIRVDYEYDRNGVQKSQYTKSLGKITFISPG